MTATRARRLSARSRLLVALMVGALGFALVVQLRTTQESEGLSAAREDDLVRILDDLNARSERLRGEIGDLQRTRDRLSTGSDRDAAARQESRRREDVLAVLAGTVATHGPGIILTISDPEGAVDAEVLLDTLQELRDAGAEAVQVNTVRLGAPSHFVDSGNGISADGQPLRAPYRFLAIGDPHTLEDAMDIPGGVRDVVAGQSGARASVARHADVRITALRVLSSPRYARPASDQGG